MLFISGFLPTFAKQIEIRTLRSAKNWFLLVRFAANVLFICVQFRLNYGLPSPPPNTPLLRENPHCHPHLLCRKHNKPTRSNM